MSCFYIHMQRKSGLYPIRTVPLWKHPSYRCPCFLSLWKLRSQVKEVIKLIRTQQKKDFAMANRSVKSNRDLPKRLWRVGEVHTNLEISMLSFLLLGKSLDLFEEDKSTKYEENNSRKLDSAKHSSEGNKVECWSLQQFLVKLATDLCNCEGSRVCKENLNETSLELFHQKKRETKLMYDLHSLNIIFFTCLNPADSENRLSQSV